MQDDGSDLDKHVRLVVGYEADVGSLQSSAVKHDGIDLDRHVRLVVRCEADVGGLCVSTVLHLVCDLGWHVRLDVLRQAVEDNPGDRVPGRRHVVDHLIEERH